MVGYCGTCYEVGCEGDRPLCRVGWVGFSVPVGTHNISSVLKGRAERG